MSLPPDHAGRVRALFTRIAPHYDLLNGIMALGQDARWRDEAVRRADLFPGARLLDIGAGTGDLAGTAHRRHPSCQVIAADFTLGMLKEGRRRTPVNWSAADALALPFPDSSFDSVVSGFLLRNVSDCAQALREQYRVLRSPDPVSGSPGGRVVILDTTRPSRNPFTPLIWIHMHRVIPALGLWLAGSRSDYAYLTTSTENFFRAETLANMMREAGFARVGFQRRMFGTIAIHWGQKLASPVA
jgi:demethylmenaquinone methyltransferase / 2-methoxy-6-polyprenyl-1,4-benzoquinol methylase